MHDKYQIEYINYKFIEKNEWNPNEQSSETFSNLVDSIKEEGCDEPIIVVEMAPQSYRVIGGEHRFRACLENNILDVPCIVKRDDKWKDAVFQMTETVRRNNLRGQLNDEKFTDMIRKINEQEELSYSEIAYRTGFDNETKFMRHLLKAQEDEENKVRKYSVSSLKSSKVDIDVRNVSDIVNTILSNFGENLKNGFAWFFYEGKMHLYVSINEDLHVLIDQLINYVSQNREELITNILKCALEKELGQRLKGNPKQ